MFKEIGMPKMQFNLFYFYRDVEQKTIWCDQKRLFKFNIWQ